MNRVKELMARYSKLQKEVAAVTGVSQPTVSEWVHQKKDPSGERLKALADLFGVSTGVILCYDPIPGTEPTSPDMTDDEREMWELREAARRDPDRKLLLKLARHGTAQDVRQAVALIDALRATNPDFYDGDDPA